MSVAQGQLLTAEQFAEMTELGRCELIAGEVKSMTPAGYRHGAIAGNLFGLLWTHVRGEQLGLVCAAETGFLLARDPDTVRAPDVAFVRRGRAGEGESAYFPGAPDLAAEVVSPDERVKEVQDKVTSWLEGGARLVWVVWPNTRTVCVHRPGEAVRTLRDDETLDGGDVVDGFQCRVSEIFQL